MRRRARKKRWGPKLTIARVGESAADSPQFANENSPKDRSKMNFTLPITTCEVVGSLKCFSSMSARAALVLRGVP